MIDGRDRYLMPGLVDMHVHVREADHDQARKLTGARVVVGHACLYLLGSAQAEQRRAVADLEQLLIQRSAERDVRHRRFQVWIGQQRPHDRPVVLVLAGYRQADTEVVGLVEKYKTFYIPAQIDFGSEKALE